MAKDLKTIGEMSAAILKKISGATGIPASLLIENPRDAEMIALDEKLDVLFLVVRAELHIATKKFGSFVNRHEGYAVILEELDELWDEIKKQQQSTPAIQREATQVAAMAIRFLLDVGGSDDG